MFFFFEQTFPCVERNSCKNKISPFLRDFRLYLSENTEHERGFVLRLKTFEAGKKRLTILVKEHDPNEKLESIQSWEQYLWTLQLFSN